MKKKSLENIIDQESEIASRRKFLKQLAYSSLLALSGSEIATASVRDIIMPSKQGHGRIYSHNSHSISNMKEVNSRTEAHHTHTQSLSSSVYKTLSFEHAHTGDKLKLTYFERGRYIKDALNEINYLLRDYHTDDIHPIDTALLDQLFDLKQTLGVSKPFHIVSGYRSPATNAELRKHSHAVAEHSFHMQGRAIDIRIEGLTAKTIRNAALTMARGGVGYYPYDDFIHLDTGDIRSW
ncbi:MAG: DUF882 domain-containing protein [Methylococcales bacterium]